MLQLAEGLICPERYPHIISPQLGLVYNWWVWTGFGQDWGCLKSRNAVRLVVWDKNEALPA